MTSFLSIGIGWFLGFAFGIGCSLVVLYAIYLGGYRKAVEDSLRDPQPDNYRRLCSKAKQSLDTTAQSDH